MSAPDDVQRVSADIAYPPISGDIAFLPPFPPVGGSQTTTPKSSSREAAGAGSQPLSSPKSNDRQVTIDPQSAGAGSGGIVPQGPMRETRVVSEGRQTQRLYLSSLPPQMAKALAVYDTDFDGILSEKDVATAASDLQHMQALAENEKEGKIPLDFFPDDVRKLLNEFDENGDGELDVIEIMKGFGALQEERGRKRTLVRTVICMILFTAALCIATAYLFAFVIEENEDTKLGSAVMRVKGSDAIVQMASAQFAVGSNGVLMNRPAPNSDCTNDQCSDPLKLAHSLQKGQLHSMLPDENLEELRHMKISSENSWIQFKVMATARYPALGGSKFGSVVVVYTHLGEITLDGDQLSFHESLDGAFRRAGFEVDSSRRQLKSVVEVVGMFNFLSRAIDQDLINNLTKAVDFVNGLSTYKAEVRKALVCQTVGDGCWLPSGAFVDHLEAWGSDDRAIVEHQKQEMYSINSEPWARTESVKKQFPLQKHHEIFNSTHKLSYQTFTNINAQTFPFWCTLSESNDSPQVVTGSSPSRNTAQNTGLQVESLGTQTFEDGQVVNGWKVTFGGQVLEYYQLDSTKLVYQLNFGNMVYRFDSVSEDVASVSDGTLPPELDIEAIMTQCDAAVNKPQKWRANEISNTYQPQTAWGLPSDARTEPPFVTTQYSDLAAFETWFNGRFSDLTPTQWAEQGSTGNQKFCRSGTGQSGAGDGIASTFKEYVLCTGAKDDAVLGAQCCDCPRTSCSNGAGVGNCKQSGANSDADCGPFNCKAFCSGYSNLPTFMTIDITDKWECFEGSGVVQMVQDCSEVASPKPCTLHTYGTLKLDMSVWDCLEGSDDPSLPAYISAARKNAVANMVFTDADISLSTEAGVTSLSESCSLAPIAPDYQIGDVPVIVHRGVTESTQTSDWNGQGAEVFSMTVQLKVDTMVAMATACGSSAPAGSPPKVGFQLGYEVSGNLRWLICANPAGSEPAFRVCGADDPAGQVHSFEYARRIYPVPTVDTDFCGKGFDNIYRYKCSECEHPIGFTDIVGTDDSGSPLTCSGVGARRR